MTISTAAQLLERHRMQMGNELGEIYHHVCQEFCRTSSIWDHYETLFGLEERVTLMNERFALLAYNIQDALWDKVLLALCRLTDPVESLGRRNLSVQQLVPLVDTARRSVLGPLVEAAQVATSSWRNIRNRRIAHNDLDESLGNIATTLEPIARIQITEAFRIIHRIFEYFEDEYYNAELRLTQTGNHDAINMLMDVFDGRRFQELETARFTENFSGVPTAYPAWLEDQMPFDERYEDRSQM